MLSKSFPLLSLTLLALSAGASPIAPIGDTMIIYSSREAAPAGFISNGSSPAEKTIDIRIVLTSNDMPGLQNALYDVSTPKSTNYRNFLSKEQVNSFLVLFSAYRDLIFNQVEEFVKPSDEATSAVSVWLKANDLKATMLSPAGEWIKITVPVSKANKLFDADYHTYTNTQSGAQGLRTLSYSLPASLKGAVEAIHPGTSFDFGSLKAPKLQVPSSGSQEQSESIEAKAKRDLPSSCNSEMSPACLQRLYGIPTTPATQKSNKIAVSGFVNQYAQQKDLQVSERLLVCDIAMY
jgi:tripeptidyl-peptidase-1